MNKIIFVFLATLTLSFRPAIAHEGDDHGHEESAKEKEHAHGEEGHKHDEEKGHDHSKEESGHAHKEDEDEHKHEESEKGHAHSEGEEGHGHEEGGGDHAHGEGEEEEGGSAVGPDKGIVEKNANGFKLSPEAVKSFDLKTADYSDKSMELPRAALIEVKDQQFAYRLRDGFIKRVPAKPIKKSRSSVVLEISDVKAGDKILVGGTGFVRIAELVAEEGVAHGHSH